MQCLRVVGRAAQQQQRFQLARARFATESFEDHVQFSDPALLAKAAARDTEVRTDHLRLNTEFPASSQAPSSIATVDEIRRKRLIYRSVLSHSTVCPSLSNIYCFHSPLLVAKN
jgi:hypothetical protein